MRTSLEPYAAWIEQTIGVLLSESPIVEADCNPGDLVAEELLIPEAQWHPLQIVANC
jgi:hypothetical protein